MKKKNSTTEKNTQSKLKKKKLEETSTTLASTCHLFHRKYENVPHSKIRKFQTSIGHIGHYLPHWSVI